MITVPHCQTCICGKRAPTQGDWSTSPNNNMGPGTISWEEHCEAWSAYSVQYRSQSAEDIANRGGFSYFELVTFLGRQPKTWKPR